MASLAYSAAHLFCDYCGNVYSNPHSLICGHIFCLSPCILSFENDGFNVLCHNCKGASHVDNLIYAKEIAEEVRVFQLNNRTIARSTCVNCHCDCNECEMCSHCDRYLCRKCVKAHETTNASVLLGRILDLKMKYNRLIKRRIVSENRTSGNAMQNLKDAVEGALLRIEICLESMEILINEVSLDKPELAPKLADVANLFDSSKRPYVLATPHMKATPAVAVQSPESSFYLPLSFQGFVDKYRRPSIESDDSLRTSMGSHLLQPSPPPPLSNLPTTPKPSSKISPMRKAGVVESKSGIEETVQLIAKSPRIIIQRLKKEANVEIPTEDEVKKYFQNFGTIEDINIKPETTTGFIDFSNISEAQMALCVAVHMVNGCPFKVIPGPRVSKAKSKTVIGVKADGKVESESVQPLADFPVQSSMTYSPIVKPLPIRLGSSEEGEHTSIVPVAHEGVISRVAPVNPINRCILVLPSSCEPRAFPAVDAIRDHFVQFGKVIQVARYFDPLRAYVLFETFGERMKALSVSKQIVGDCEVTVCSCSHSGSELEVI
ncbi:hypothetical protein Aperf_G00000028141 [Anoplocephala perfoliata]